MRRHILRVEGLAVESPYLRWSRACARWLSRWRSELVTLFIAWLLYAVLSAVAGVVASRGLVAVTFVGLLAWPASRGCLGRTLLRWWTRRRFLVAMRRLTLVSDFDRSPTVSRIRDLLAATTGMRWAELCGLRWPAVYLDRGTLSVTTSRVVVRGHAQDSDDTKSERGRRLLALDPITVDGLRAQRGRQDEERSAFGTGYGETDLVLPGRTGGRSTRT